MLRNDDQNPIIFRHSILMDAELDGVDFTSARLEDVTFNRIRMAMNNTVVFTDAYFRFPKFQQVEFGQAGTDFSGAILPNARFLADGSCGMDLTHVTFTERSDVEKIDLRGICHFPKEEERPTARLEWLDDLPTMCERIADEVSISEDVSPRWRNEGCSVSECANRSSCRFSDFWSQSADQCSL